MILANQNASRSWVPALGAGLLYLAFGVPAVAQTTQSTLAAKPVGLHSGPWIGVVLPLESVAVAPRVRGVLERVEVRAGDPVEKGALLATIEDHETRQQLRIAVAELSAAGAELEHEQVQVRRELSRFERRSTTAELWSEEELASSEVDLKAAEAQARAAEAEVERARATVDQLERRLEALEVRAPFAGRVSIRHLDPGAAVDPATAIIRLVSGSARLVRFAVPPDEIYRPVRGTVVAVFDADPGDGPALGMARVHHVAPEIDLASQRIFVEAILEEPTLLREPRGGLGVEVRPAEANPSETTR